MKLYYTESELREMANEIKRNGLPPETIKTLQEQGWTNEEIQALQDYIAQSADSIKGDFNMSEFLKNFSTAFVKVGFEYANYETWGLEKWKWRHAPRFNGKLPDNVTINPLFAKEWVSFYEGYTERNVSKMSNSLDNLTSKIYDFLSTASPNSHSSKIQPLPQKTPVIKSGRLVNRTLIVRPAYLVNRTQLYHGGFVTVTTIMPEMKNHTPVLYVNTMYWPTALKAYNLTRQIYVLTHAIEQGNEDPELWWILNQKVGELKEALKTYMSTKIETEPERILDPITRYPRPITDPPKPVPPRTFYPVGSEKDIEETSGDLEVIPLTNAGVEALTLNNNKGLLQATVCVEPVDITSSYATYRVRVSMEAKNNVVTDIRISVQGTGLSDSESIGMLHPDDGTTEWRSGVSKAVRGSERVRVTGEVKITYTSYGGHRPNSGGDVHSENIVDSKEITLRYSAEINLKEDINPAKVSVSVQPSKGRIKAGDSVYFTVTVFNDNSQDVKGDYTLKVTIPQDSGRSATKSFSGHIVAQAGSYGETTIGPVTYWNPGEYGYHVVFHFGQYSKSDGGTIVVVNPNNSGNDDSSGSLEIKDVRFSPETPKEGDSVVFNIKVYNSYRKDKNVKLRLFIDGSEAGSVEGSVSAGSTREFSLQWKAEAGEHSYGVRLYRVDEKNGEEALEYSEGGKINVARADQQFAVSLDAFPTKLEGGGTVFFTVRIWNFDSSAISVRGFVEDESGAIIKRIDGFEGRAPANGEKNISFSYTIHGVGNHTFRVFLDNYDGEPNGAGEEHWAEVTVEVKPVNGTELKQVGFECDDPEFNWNGIEYKASLVCRATVYNPSQNNIEINIVSVKTWSVGNHALEDSLSRTWEVKYPNKIHGSETATIVFKNTAHTGLITLEKDLFGSYVSIWLTYLISPQGRDDITFTGTDTVNIRQDNKDVIVDVGTNFVIIGGEVKVFAISAKLIKAGEVAKGFSQLIPVIADFIRRAYSWR